MRMPRERVAESIVRQHDLDAWYQNAQAACPCHVCRDLKPALVDPCPCDTLREETEAAKAEAAARLKQYLTQVEIHTRNTKEWRVALDAAESERDKLRAENADLRKQIAEHQEWLRADSQYAENRRLEAANADLRQQSLSHAAEVVQMLAVVRAAERMMASHPSWCRPEPKPGLGCACGLTDLRNAIADYQDSLQGRQA